MNKDFYLSPERQFFFFCVIAMFNFFFLVMWFVKLLDIMRDNIKENYRKCYIILFLCGRTDKMENEEKKRAKTRKKEAIIANIDHIILYLQNMKSMYERDVFYEDHDRFLKLLYYIEQERG